MLSLVALVSTASAQQENVSPNIQHFLPTGSTQGFATVPSARQLPQKGFGFDIVANYAHRPFQRSAFVDGVLTRDEGAVDALFAAHLRAAYGVTKWLEVALDAPVFNYTSTAPALTDFGGNDGSVGFGDVTVNVHLRPVSEELIGIAVIPFVTAPTGTRKTFLTHGVPTVGARAVFSKTVNPVHLSGTIGYRLVPTGGFVDTEVSVDDTLMYGAGVGFLFAEERVRLNLEADGAIVVGPARTLVETSDIKAALHSPLEVMADLRIKTPSGVGAMLGGGPGLTPAVGTPVFRVFAGITYATPSVKDTDGDGYIDSKDDCPTEPEDFDEWLDEDGCPDPDNDNDGIYDVTDRCPNDPEDFDQFQDQDGCPDPDNDNDRILDINDRCPMQPEDYDGVEDLDGCPDAELIIDSDRDGLVDPVDRCPFEPEDIDGFQDQDGCPDPDNDQDRILDLVDLCPLDPENYNGVKDEDGCPDAQKVVVTRDRIVILDKVLFYTAKDVIVPESYPILEAVLEVLQKYPNIKRVRIEGHTDSRGSDSYNLDLSNRRALAIRKFLVDRGIERDRLDAEGFGELSPLLPNTSAENMEKNRRVEFHIIEQE